MRHPREANLRHVAEQDSGKMLICAKPVESAIMITTVVITRIIIVTILAIITSNKNPSNSRWFHVC